MPDPTLSVVVITMNEEADLPGLLDNFLPFADEIVIIDDGSTDRTEEIAHAAGEKVRFIRSPRGPDGGFDGQRNKGVAAATSEWLLQIDADMRLSPELAAEMKQAIRSPDMAAYRYRYLQYFMNRPVRYGGFQYRNDAWLSRRTLSSWTRKVHEQIFIDAPADRIGQLQGKMHHLTDIDFSERLRKNYQYSHLEAEKLIARGVKVSFARMLLHPLWRGFRSYVMMKGFLDGKVGFFWALYQVTSNMVPLYIVWSKQNGGNRAEVERRIAAECAVASGADGR